MSSLQASFVADGKSAEGSLPQLSMSDLQTGLTVLRQVDLDFVPWLNDNDLKQMGVTALGPRRKILAAAAKLAADASKSDQMSAAHGGDDGAAAAHSTDRYMLLLQMQWEAPFRTTCKVWQCSNRCACPEPAMPSTKHSSAEETWLTPQYVACADRQSHSKLGRTPLQCSCSRRDRAVAKAQAMQRRLQSQQTP